MYGGGQWDGFGLRLGAAYSWHRITTARTVDFSGYSDRLGSDYDARTLQFFGELGYRIDSASVQLEPFVALAYLRQSVDGFAERGGLAALSGRGDSNGMTFSTLGLRAASTFTMGSTDWVARGTLGWRHAFGDVTPTSSLSLDVSSAFSVRGTDRTQCRRGRTGPGRIDRQARCFQPVLSRQLGNGRRDNGIRAGLLWKF